MWLENKVTVLLEVECFEIEGSWNTIENATNETRDPDLGHHDKHACDHLE